MRSPEVRADRTRPLVRRSAAAAVAIAAFLAVPLLAFAATPTPEAGGDPRSPGQGPGLVGDPLLAVGIVLLIGIAALVTTLGWVRLTSHGERRERR